MKIKWIKLAVVLLLMVVGFAYALPTITNYAATFVPLYTKQGQLGIGIRHFEKNNVWYFLIVNPITLQTYLAAANDQYPRDPNTDGSTPGYPEWKNIENTPYLKALSRYAQYPGKIENAGITHAENKNIPGYFLTVDMCPSVKPFEKKFYQRLVELSSAQHKPFPVAISMSGLWMLQHDKEFDWLLKMQKENKLNITWVNHSFSHVFFRDLPYQNNFLLFKPTNLLDEIYANEIALIQRGQVPSVFFRLPGLVADKAVLITLRDNGLIPLGTDAWLAENQLPTNGSIILVHGNSNEPQGIQALMPYLNNTNSHWLPINELIANSQH